jgi:hypothetical protein
MMVRSLRETTALIVANVFRVPLPHVVLDATRRLPVSALTPLANLGTLSILFASIARKHSTALFTNLEESHIVTCITINKQALCVLDAAKPLLASV